MKLRKLSILAAIALVFATAITSCSKDDGAIPDRVSIEDIPVVSINFASSSTLFLDTLRLANQATFEGKFGASLFFPGALPPTKVDIVVRKNGATASVKVFKADVTTLPATFTIKASDIVALFGGAALESKQTYEFALDLYVGTKKYEAWPASGVTGSGSGVTGMSGIGFGEKVTYYVK